MSTEHTGFVPLSVRRGLREPFRLVEGVPRHARALLAEWMTDVFMSQRNDRGGHVRVMISALQLPFDTTDPGALPRLLANFDAASETPEEHFYFLDVLDYMTRVYPSSRQDLASDLETAGSVWRVDLDEGGLRRRVPDEALASYEKALEEQPSAAEHLSNAWAHAFGLHSDPGRAWGDAIKALEAVLSPIVIPDARLAKLSDIQSAVRNAPEGKFVIRAAGRDPKASLSGMLDAIPYEPGRHGSDPTRAEIETGRVVVLQATAILAAVGEGLITRADSSE